MKQLSLILLILLLNIFVIGEAYGDELIRTDNPLDLSIVGEGCFLKLTKGRHNKYIKSASMQFNKHREVVDKQGYALGIKSPEQATHIDISKAGRVLAYLNNDLAQEIKLKPIQIHKMFQGERCQVKQGMIFARR